MTHISITTITYNSISHIERCLESVRNQTVPADEFVVVDGQSSDGTCDILEKAKSRNEINKLCIEPDDGISDAFNKAWKHASCEFICNLNSDDHLKPNHIEQIKKIIQCDNPDIVISIMSFRNEHHERIIHPNLPNGMPPTRWINPAINHPGMVIRRSLLEQVGGYDQRYKIAMDVDLFYRLLRLSPKISINANHSVVQEDGGVSQKKWRLGLRELRVMERLYGRDLVSAWGAFFWRVSKKQLKNTLTSMMMR